MQIKKFKGISMGHNPESDWKIIFFAAFAIALVVMILNVFVYIKIDKGEIFVVEGEGGAAGKTLNIEELRTTLDYYQTKSENFQRIIRSASSTPVSDPSL